MDLQPDCGRNTSEGRNGLLWRRHAGTLRVAITERNPVRTVETHRKNIKAKLGISSTAGLTRYALEHGVLQGTGVRL